VDAARLEVGKDVRTAFFELAYIDRALTIVERNRSVLGDVIQVTEAHYASGKGGQQDVLKARVEAARLGETASALLEERRATSAELNATLNRDDTTSFQSAAIPERIVQAAIPAIQIAFGSPHRHWARERSIRHFRHSPSYRSLPFDRTHR